MIQAKYRLLLILLIICATLSSVYIAYASNNKLNDSILYAAYIKQATTDISNARTIHQNGIKLKIIFEDNSSTTLTIKQRTESLNPEESIQLYLLPTNEQILRTLRIEKLNIDRMNSIHYKVEIFENGIRDFILQSLDNKLFESKPASYSVVSREITIEPHTIGSTIDMDNTILLIKDKLSKLDTKTLSIYLKLEPPSTTLLVLENHLDFAKALIKWGGVTLTYNKSIIKLTGKEILPAIRFDAKDNVYLDSEIIRARLRLSIGYMIEKPSKPPLFGYKEGRLFIKSPGEDGNDVNIEEVSSRISDYLKTKVNDYEGSEMWPISRYELTITKHSNNLTKSKMLSMGVDSLLGTARISFKGSSKDRIHNIALGSSRVTGTIVEPNEEFSLVSAIGYTATTSGYTEEYVIKENRSRKEAGGGLCQVATTFFRAVLDAGLKITERHNHRYVVSYYGPGLDAGIYDINHDFRFMNDTGNKLMLQAYTEGEYMVVDIFGRNDGRKSITSKPIETLKIRPPEPQYYFGSSISFGKTECTDHPRMGMTTYATTTITYLGGATSTKVWKSVYIAWPKICVIGTKGLNVLQYDN